MRDLLFPSTPALTGALREAARAAARAFAAECRAIGRMVDAAEPDQREFVHGEVACVLHLAPVTALHRSTTALSVLAQPRLLAALEDGRLGVPHALAVLDEISHLDPPHAAAVLDAVLDPALGDEPTSTAGELRGACRRAAIRVCPDTARRRHAAARRTAGVRGRPGRDGMGQVVIDCTATQMATALAAIDGRAAAMAADGSFDDPDLTVGQQRVAAFLHAIGCDRTRVQAVVECPVDAAVDLHALSAAPVWTVDVRLPVAVALGLSDHPALLAGYGPLDADQARALLPCADLVRACVDSTTGEVLAVDPPRRPPRRRPRASPGTARPPAHRPPTTGPPGRGDHPIEPAAAPDTRPGRLRARTAGELRAALVELATTSGTVPAAATDGYVPTEALGRLVDLRDVTSVFPGDSTSARRTDRDHRLPYPLGPTSAENLQALSRHWHRAKHAGWHTRLLADGTTRWTSPSGGVSCRPPKRTPPPPVPPGATLPPAGEPRSAARRPPQAAERPDDP